jgi:hypothetical protein
VRGTARAGKDDILSQNRLRFREDGKTVFGDGGKRATCKEKGNKNDITQKLSFLSN